MDEPTLLVRPLPLRGEGPQGYLLRLAEANFMNLHDLAQLGIRFAVGSLQHHQLLPDPSLDPGLYTYMQRIEAQFDKTGRNWNRQRARFCPHCLGESSVWQVSWELLFQDACPEHGVWLVDQCSSCASPVRWDREHLLRCPCGADLRAELSRSCPPAVQRLSVVLAAKLVGQEVPAGFELPLLQAMNVAEIQQLVRFLGACLDPAAGAKPLKRHRAGAMSVSWPVTSLAAEIINDWPRGFHLSLSALQDLRPTEKRGLRSFLQNANYYLYHGLRGRVFDPVRRAFEAWLADHWKGGLAKRNRRLTLDLIAQVQWIPGNVARDQLRVSATRLYSLVKEGLIDGQESISASGRKFLMVRRDQLESIRDQLAGEMTMTAATAALGIGKIRLRRLLRLLFHSARRICDSPYMSWCVPRNEVEALLALGADLAVVGIPDEHHVSLAHIFKFWNWNAEEIVGLVEAVKAGTIILHARLDSAKGISGWVFETAQLRAWHLALNNGRSNWLSIPAAAKSLGVKQQVVYWLTQNGFLLAEKLGMSKGLGSRIHREEFERFRQRHVFGRQIAALMGTSSRKARERLDYRGIHPLRGTSAEPCRMLIYVLSEELQRIIDELELPPQEVFQLAGE